jgi:hypothetical protein
MYTHVSKYKNNKIKGERGKKKKERKKNLCGLLSLVIKCPQKTLVFGQSNLKPTTSPATHVLTLCLDGIGIDRGIGSSGSPPRL